MEDDGFKLIACSPWLGGHQGGFMNCVNCVHGDVCKHREVIEELANKRHGLYCCVAGEIIPEGLLSVSCRHYRAKGYSSTTATSVDTEHFVLDDDTQQTPTLIAGTSDVGSCCGCDFIDSTGNEYHKAQYQLFYCQNQSCDHLCCTKHLEPCGYCQGCCAELHGLGSH